MPQSRSEPSHARRYVLLAIKLSVSIILLVVLFSRVDVAQLWRTARLASVPWLLVALCFWMGGRLTNNAASWVQLYLPLGTAAVLVLAVTVVETLLYVERLQARQRHPRREAPPHPRRPHHHRRPLLPLPHLPSSVIGLLIVCNKLSGPPCDV